MNGHSVAIIGTRGYPSFYGGFETLVRRLAPYLAEEGWDTTVYGRGRTVDAGVADGDPRVKRINTRGVESRSLSTLTYGLTSSLHCARTQPDVALLMNVANGFWLPLLRSRGIPTLVNVDGIEWERAKWGRAARTLFRTGASVTARQADGLIFDSKALGVRWGSEFRREGEFIPYGGSFRTRKCAPDGLVSRRYVLMVARFVPENTIDEFLTSAVRLSEKWDVVVVGSSGYGGPTEESLRQLADQNERVKWLGHVSDDDRLFALWENAGAYFHGHSVGGTNPALVQAMACGAPTVARDTVFNREVLEDAGVYVAPTPDAIFDGISKVMEDPNLQKQMSDRSIARAEESYTWDEVCRRYSSILYDLATAGPSVTRQRARIN